LSKAVLSFVVVIGLLGIASTAARADIDDPSAARAEAKRLRDLGAQAMDRGALADAFAAFERANELYPSPNLRFNMGVALEGLGRLDEAVEAFEDFLAAPNAPADASDYARTRLRDLEPQIARLALTVSPANAEIRVDGRRVKLSRGRDLPVMPGERSVTATLNGYQSKSANITVAPSARGRLDLTLRPLPGAELVVPAPTDGGAEARRTVRSLGAAALGTGAVGVAALVLGIVFADLTVSADHQINHPPPDSQFDPTLASRGRTYQALEVTFFSVGAAAVGSVVVLGSIAASKRRHHAPPAAATVAASPSGFAISF